MTVGENCMTGHSLGETNTLLKFWIMSHVAASICMAFNLSNDLGGSLL